MGEGENVALEFVGGSITSQALGEIDITTRAAPVTLQGNDANSQTDPAIIETLRGINPWVDAAGLRPPRLRQGHGDAQDGFDCELVRVETIKRRTRPPRCPPKGFRWRVARGQTSIKGVNGPAAAARIPRPGIRAALPVSLPRRN